jgi:peptidoglycan hydrolase-like protein with peptidoglycan-binding domain
MARKKKKPPLKPGQPVVRPENHGGGGQGWFGEPDRLTDPTSQGIPTADPLAGRNLLSGAKEANANPLSPADAFVAAIISGDHDRIQATYAKVSASDAPKIKASFIAMPQEQRDTVVKNVDANKDLFGWLPYTSFKTMMKDAPPPPKDAKPLIFDSVALEGDDARQGLAAAMGARVVPRDSSGGTYTAADLTAHGVGSKYAEQNARNLNTLDPSIRGRYADAIAQFYQEHGADGYDLAIYRAGVSEAEQARVKATTTGRAATPAGSWHTIGAAADFTIFKNGKADPGGSAYTTLLRPALVANGLNNPFGDDVGHAQPAELPLSRAGRQLSDFIKAPYAPIEAGAVGGVQVAAAGGGVESYIRQSAAARGIDPDVAVRVAKGEGGLANPLQQSYVVKNGQRETSYGPFQLRIGGGLGDAALKAGIDPRKESDWQAGVDFALNHAAEHGWGEWYGAVNPGPKSGLSPISSRAGLAGAKPVAIGLIAGGSSVDAATGGATSVGGRDHIANAIQRSGGIQKGSRDTAANKAIQNFLVGQAVGDRIGAPIKADGVFGNRTKEAVRNYQARNGIKPDGVVGPDTFAHMNADMADGEPPKSAGQMRGLQPTPQELHLYEHHLDELSKGGVHNPDGSISTVKQITVERDGKSYNIPTVWGGKVVSNDEAIKRAGDQGWDSWPSYPSEQAAQQRYDAMHGAMEMDTGGATPFSVGAGTMPGGVYRSRDFNAGAAAAAITVDPAVARAFVPSGKATLTAALDHPDEQFVSSDREWDPAAARIANTLRDGERMAAQVAAAKAGAGQTKFATGAPIEAGVTIPKSFEEWSGGGPGTGTGKEYQQKPQQGLTADIQRAWEATQRGFDVEHWLQEPTVQDSGTFGTSDQFRPTGGMDFGGSSSSGGSFDDFASGMASTYQAVQSGGSWTQTFFPSTTPTTNTFQDYNNPTGNDYTNVGGIP